MNVTEIVYVMKVDDDWWVQFTGTECDELLSNFKGYWYGPLKVPELKP
jgi:hypothetical protein